MSMMRKIFYHILSPKICCTIKEAKEEKNAKEETNAKRAPFKNKMLQTENCGVVWCGVVWCGVVWCGVVWCGVVWCGVV